MVEQPRSLSTQPRSATRCLSLYRSKESTVARHSLSLIFPKIGYSFAIVTRVCPFNLGCYILPSKVLSETPFLSRLWTNGMGMDPFVVFPAEWAAAGFEIHATPPTLPFPSG